MAQRGSWWRWSRAGWQRLALALLWLGHGVWVMLGPQPGRAWERVAEGLSRPAQSLATSWEHRRAARQSQGMNLEDTRKAQVRAEAELTNLRTQAERDAPRLAEGDEAIRLLLSLIHI